MSTSNELPSTINSDIKKIATYHSNLAQSYPDSANTPVQFNVDVEIDTHVTKQVGNNSFLINEDGAYLLHGTVFLNGVVGGVTNFLGVRFTVNGSVKTAQDLGQSYSGGIQNNAGSSSMGHLYPVKLTAGDTVGFQVRQLNSNALNRTANANAFYNQINIVKL